MLQWVTPPDAGKRVTILNASRIQQYQLIWQLLSQYQTVFLPLEPPSTTPVSLQQQLDSACIEQSVTSPNNIEYVVIMDCDCAPPDSLSSFLKSLLRRSAHIHVVLGTRLTCASVIDEELAPRTRFFPQERPSAETHPGPAWLLEVSALGQGLVISQGRVINDWQGELTRNLFFYVLNNPIVTRDEVHATFWQRKTPREAANLFHVTRLRLKNILGVELLEFGGGFYRISGQIHLVYDVNEFFDLLDASQKAESDDEAVVLLEKAVRLYRGSYFSWLNYNTAMALRRRCEEEYCDALVRLACLHFKRGDAWRALGLLARVSRLQMGREDVILKIMQIYMEKGQPADALHAYHRLEGFTKASAGIFRPSDEMQRLVREAEKLQVRT